MALVQTRTLIARAVAGSAYMQPTGVWRGQVDTVRQVVEPGDLSKRNRQLVPTAHQLRRSPTADPDKPLEPGAAARGLDP